MVDGRAAAALLTLRHRITQTGANTLEAYFQPRLLAFALGAWAIAAYLRGKGGVAVVLIAVAFALHPTTAMWFGDVGCCRTCRYRALVAHAAARRRRSCSGDGNLGREFRTVERTSRGDGLTLGLRARGQRLHLPIRLERLILAREPVLSRRRGWRFICGDVREEWPFRERPDCWQAPAALLCLFLVSWPLMIARLALVLQLQTSRIFWMLDFLAAIYLAWLLAEAPRRGVLRRAIVVSFVAIAIGRGIFVWRVEHAGDPVIRINFPQDNWTDAMRWISRTPANTHVLADPGHAWKYGTSVRVSGERDVYLEEVKDLALALYSRDVAVEALQRIRDVQNFSALTSDQFAVTRQPLRSRLSSSPIATSICRSLIATNSSACIRCSRNESSEFRASPPMEGGALDDVVRVGETQDVCRTSPCTGQVLRCRSRFARARPLPLAGSSVGTSDTHRAARTRELERCALRTRPRRESLPRRLQRRASESAKLRRHRTPVGQPLSFWSYERSDRRDARARGCGWPACIRRCRVFSGRQSRPEACRRLRRDCRRRELRAVCAVSPTMDLAVCVDALEEKHNAIYQWHFVRNLKRRMRRKAQAFPGKWRSTRCGESDRFGSSTMRTQLRITDSATRLIITIAPARCASSTRSAFRRLIITAADDPFVPAGPFREAAVVNNRNITVMLTLRRRPLRICRAVDRRITTGTGPNARSSSSFDSMLTCSAWTHSSQPTG